MQEGDTAPGVEGASWDPAAAELLDRARAGDPAALGELLASLRAYLLAAAHRTLDSELSPKMGPSDVVQDTFLLAQQNFANFNGTSEAELRAWLGRILENRCRDLRDAFCGSAKRDIKREIRLDVDDSNVSSPLAELEDRGSTPSAHAIGQEDAARLLAALKLLADDQRQIVWLRNWENLSFDEIGRRTGRTAEAVRKVFCRAVERLSTLLGQVDGEHPGG